MRIRIAWLNCRIVTTLGAAAGAMVLMGSAGLVAAYAEPTPSPTPGATVSPTPSVSATATAEATTTPTPSPVRESTLTTPTTAPTPTPTPSAEKTVAARGTKDAARTTQLRRPLQAKGQQDGVSVLAADLADPRFTVEVVTTCNPPTITITLTLNVDEAITLDYRVTDEGRFDQIGTVNLQPNPGVATITIPEGEPVVMDAGVYHVDLFNAGEDDPVAVQNFDLLSCVTDQADCQRFTWDGYSEVPVTLVYGEGNLADADPDEATVVQLPLGERIIRTDWTSLYWFAGIARDGAGDNEAFALGGEVEEAAIPHDCTPADLTITYSSCTPAGGPTVANILVERQDGDFYRYEVLDTDGDVVASRSVPDDGTAQGVWQEELPRVGTYRFNYYLNGSETVTETTVFSAVRCLTVTRSCRQFTFTNPSSNPPVYVEYYLLNEDPSGDFVLPPGGSRVVSWQNLNEQFSLRWFSRADNGASAGLGSEPGIPVDCTPSPQPSPTATSPAPQPGPGGDDDDGLADTGSPTGAVGGLVLGLLLVTAGTVLLVRRRSLEPRFPPHDG